MAKLYEFPVEGGKKAVPMKAESDKSPFNVGVQALYNNKDIHGVTLSEGADGLTYEGVVKFPAQGVIPKSFKWLVFCFTEDKREIEWWHTAPP